MTQESLYHAPHTKGRRGLKKRKKSAPLTSFWPYVKFWPTTFCYYSKVSDCLLLIQMTVRSFCKGYSFYLHCRNSRAGLESEPCCVSQTTNTRTELVHTQKSFQYNETTSRGIGKQDKTVKTVVLVPFLMLGRKGGRRRIQRIYTADTQHRDGTYFFCLNTRTTGAHNSSPLYRLLSDCSIKIQTFQNNKKKGACSYRLKQVLPNKEGHGRK